MDNTKDNEQQPIEVNLTTIAEVSSLSALRKRTGMSERQIFEVPVTGEAMPRKYMYDAGDKTSVDDGDTVIVTAKGARFIRIELNKAKKEDVIEPVVYSNAEQTYTATCGEGYTGSNKVTIPAGVFTSTESQADANELAQADAKSKAEAGLICTPVYKPPVTDVTAPQIFVDDIEIGNNVYRYLRMVNPNGPDADIRWSFDESKINRYREPVQIPDFAFPKGIFKAWSKATIDKPQSAVAESPAMVALNRQAVMKYEEYNYTAENIIEEAGVLKEWKEGRGKASFALKPSATPPTVLKNAINGFPAIRTANKAQSFRTWFDDPKGGYLRAEATHWTGEVVIRFPQVPGNNNYVIQMAHSWIEVTYAPNGGVRAIFNGAVVDGIPAGEWVVLQFHREPNFTNISSNKIAGKTVPQPYYSSKSTQAIIHPDGDHAFDIAHISQFAGPLTKADINGRLTSLATKYGLTVAPTVLAIAPELTYFVPDVKIKNAVGSIAKGSKTVKLKAAADYKTGDKIFICSKGNKKWGPGGGFPFREAIAGGSYVEGEWVADFKTGKSMRYDAASKTFYEWPQGDSGWGWIDAFGLATEVVSVSADGLTLTVKDAAIEGVTDTDIHFDNTSILLQAMATKTHIKMPEGNGTYCVSSALYANPGEGLHGYGMHFNTNGCTLISPPGAEPFTFQQPPGRSILDGGGRLPSNGVQAHRRWQLSGYPTGGNPFGNPSVGCVIVQQDGWDNICRNIYIQDWMAYGLRSRGFNNTFEDCKMVHTEGSSAYMGWALQQEGPSANGTIFRRIEGISEKWLMFGTEIFDGNAIIQDCKFTNFIHATNSIDPNTQIVNVVNTIKAGANPDLEGNANSKWFGGNHPINESNSLINPQKIGDLWFINNFNNLEGWLSKDGSYSPIHPIQFKGGTPDRKIYGGGYTSPLVVVKNAASAGNVTLSVEPLPANLPAKTIVGFGDKNEIQFTVSETALMGATTVKGNLSASLKAGQDGTFMPYNEYYVPEVSLEASDAYINNFKYRAGRNYSPNSTHVQNFSLAMTYGSGVGWIRNMHIPQLLTTQTVQLKNVTTEEVNISPVNIPPTPEEGSFIWAALEAGKKIPTPLFPLQFGINEYHLKYWPTGPNGSFEYNWLQDDKNSTVFRKASTVEGLEKATPIYSSTPEGWKPEHRFPAMNWDGTTYYRYGLVFPSSETVSDYEIVVKGKTPEEMMKGATVARLGDPIGESKFDFEPTTLQYGKDKGKIIGGYVQDGSNESQKRRIRILISTDHVNWKETNPDASYKGNAIQKEAPFSILAHADPHIHEEPDGRVYLFFAGWNGSVQSLGVVELDPDNFYQAKTAPYLLRVPDEDLELGGGRAKIFNPNIIANDPRFETAIYFAHNMSDRYEPDWWFRSYFPKRIGLSTFAK